MFVGIVALTYECWASTSWWFSFSRGFCRAVQSSAGPSSDNRGMKRKAEDSDSESEPEDDVR